MYTYTVLERYTYNEALPSGPPPTHLQCADRREPSIAVRSGASWCVRLWVQTGAVYSAGISPGQTGWSQGLLGPGRIYPVANTPTTPQTTQRTSHNARGNMGLHLLALTCSCYLHPSNSPHVMSSWAYHRSLACTAASLDPALPLHLRHTPPPTKRTSLSPPGLIQAE